ncbi:MAG: methyltransferase regulatory domain-containing protein [Hyphomicrobiales bacterium]|nr:methyltransferase regulatory domain-containing protein [Hyphomicrobiales bacterium]
MSDWGSGYVTDMAYVHDFCRVQTPPMLALATLSGGLLSVGGRSEPLVYCDVGCGQGYTANVIAAANPAARVFGYDFNPGHVANARSLAAEAGLRNVEFREASFAELADDPALPDFDIMAMHGVYSWVSPDNRRALAALARRRLKPGGLLYISYDCMPGWAAVAPLRQIFARSFSPKQGGSQHAIERALAYFDQLRASDARFFKMFPNVEAQIERLKATPRAYLAHELLPRDWEAFSFGAVAEALAEAKLDFVGSAHAPDGVDRLNFTDEQAAFLSGLDDPLLAEATRDMILCRQFRRDVFVKGRPAATAAALRARWLDTRFALTIPARDVELTFDTPAGKFQLHPQIHAPLLAAFADGPITLGAALQRAFGGDAGFNAATDAVKVLIGRGDLQPALPAEGNDARAAATRDFNSAVLARTARGEDLFYLASPVTGGGVRVDRLTQLYLAAKRKGAEDPAGFVANVVGAIEQPAQTNGEDAGARDKALRARLAHIENSIAPTLAKVGIA